MMANNMISRHIFFAVDLKIRQAIEPNQGTTVFSTTKVSYLKKKHVFPSKILMGVDLRLMIMNIV